MVHISCITRPRDLPDMYTHALRPDGPRAWVYISGKSLGYMIQLLHIVSLEIQQFLTDRLFKLHISSDIQPRIVSTGLYNLL